MSTARAEARIASAVPAGLFCSLLRNHLARIVRDGRVIVEGKPLSSLKRFKDDAREVRSGLECGIRLQDFDDVKPADVIQTYQVVEVAQEL